MLDVQLLRNEPDLVKTEIAKKNKDPKLVDTFTELDASWRSLALEVEELRTKQKAAAEARDKEQGRVVRDELQKKEATLREIQTERDIVWKQIPNLPSSDTPLGKDDTENVVIRKWGEVPEFSFPVKDHLELGETLGIINMEKAAKITGARFAYIMGDLAKMEFGLVQLVMQKLTDPTFLKEAAEIAGEGCSDKPFMPVVPPVMIKPEIFEEMGRLEPAEDRYYIPSDDVYLIGSAEHTLGPLHRKETLEEKDLPIRYLGFSTSFRREAGSYGKDTRGILRVHQFDKLEMESFTTPDAGPTEQHFFVAVQEKLVQLLGLPYQVVLACTGDQGSPNTRLVDIEMWMPSQGVYRETHSSDYMTDYQARRLKTKVKTKDGTVFAHMNDATAFAVGRTLIAIIENNQQEDGSILVPEVLQPFVGKEKIEKQ